MSSDTPQHAIRDGEFRIVYVTGNKGLYKYFPDTNQILMFKPAGTGNQGHMAGYAGYGGPPKGLLEIIVTNYDVAAGTGAPVGDKHIPSVGWLPFGNSDTLAPGVRRWTSPATNPFNPDEVLILGHETYGLNISEGRILGHGPGCELVAGPTCDEAKIWYSDDGCETFVPFKDVTLNMPTTIDPSGGATNVTFRAHRIQWDHVVDGRWAMIGQVSNLYSDIAYSHEVSALMLVVGDRSGTAHMWIRPFPNPWVSTLGYPNWPALGIYGHAWSWVDPDPDTGFHKIVIGSTVVQHASYQHLLIETSIPGPTGTSWIPAYTLPPSASDATRIRPGLAAFGYDQLSHRRGTLEVYQSLTNAQDTNFGGGSPERSIGGQVLWQHDYMEPTPGMYGSHWDTFIPGVELGGSIAAADDAVYVAGRSGGSGGGILRFPYGSTLFSQGVVVPGTEGRNVGNITTDAQHNTYILCIDGTSIGVYNFFVFDGDTWGVIEHDPANLFPLGGAAIINRTP
jgi:hypothetical protein